MSNVSPKALAVAMPPTPEPTTYQLGELFAGAGGLALGAHTAKIDSSGFAHAWASDMDSDACASFRRNLHMTSEQVLCRRVEELDFSALPPIDGLLFGFPCNDFSIIGQRKGTSGQFGGLYRWGVAALQTMKPLFFVAENVSGLSSSGGKRDLVKILGLFRKAGYDIFPHTYRFEEYGVPQARHRIVIVGFRKDLDLHFEPPEPTTKATPITCAQALANIPLSAANNEYTKQATQVVKRLQHIKPGQNAFTADIPKALRLRLKSGALISQIYRRLEPHRPAYTVTGSGGGGTHIYHWEEDRALTNRERARLQTFPDAFVFEGGKESVRKQIGMAVPPKGAEAIFRQVLRTLIGAGISGSTC